MGKSEISAALGSWAVCMPSGQRHPGLQKHVSPKSLLYSQRNPLVTESAGRETGSEDRDQGT